MADAERPFGVLTEARRARPSIRLRKSSETVRDRADALGPSWTGVDTRTPAHRQAGSAPPVHLFRGPEIRNRGYNEHLLLAACR